MPTPHPLVLVAAGAVTIASLAAAAHFAGLIPSRSETPPPAPVASQTAAVAAAPVAPPIAAASKAETVSIAPEGSQAPPSVKPRPQPASEPVKQARRSEPRHSDDNYRRATNGDNGRDVIPAPPPPPAAPPPVCRECGTVDSVREVATPGEGTGVGVVAGGVLGGVLGHQVGRGRGNDAATVIGAIGGAVAGHQIEKNVRTNKQYQVSVRFDDGNTRTYTLNNTQWRPGDRVRMSGDTLSAP